MRTKAIRAAVAGIMAAQILPGGAWAGTCATQADAAALKIAALQQELMVAAFSCHDVSQYNDFVRSHQPELIASDAALKSFFVRRQGEAAYHTYKTELANDASLDYLHDDGFCDRAADEFAGSDARDSLSAFVSARRFAAADGYAFCPDVVPLQTAAIESRRRAAQGDRGYRDDASAARDDSYEGRDRGWSRNVADDDGVYAPAPHRPIDAGVER